MSRASRLAAVLEVDAYLAATKSLSDALPHWTDSHAGGRWGASWPIQDEHGIFEEGNRLVFSGRRDDASQFSISLMYRNERVQALDLVAPGRSKPNPPDAGRLFGLPSKVSGPHAHEWRHNRHIALQDRLGRLPYRCPTPKLMTRLPHALAALAQAVNLTLTAEQASFDVPAQGVLLMREADNDM